MRPQRRQPTRLPRPWGSPGKNTGVGCHFLLQCMKVKSESEGAQLCPTPSDPMDCSLPGSSVHGIFQARVLEWSAIAFSEHFSLAPSKWSGYICQAGRLTESHFVISGYAFLLLGVLPTSHHCVTLQLKPRLRCEAGPGTQIAHASLRLCISSAVTADTVHYFQWKQCQTLFFWAPKSLQMVTAAMKLKDAYSLEGKLWPT